MRSPQVSAVGLGELVLTLTLPGADYPLYNAMRLIPNLPQHRAGAIADGMLFQRCCEAGIAQFLRESELGQNCRTVFCPSASARWPLVEGFLDRKLGFECSFGDMQTELGLPMALTSLGALRAVGRLVAPLLTSSWYPYHWLFAPSHDLMGKAKPAALRKHYRAADVIVGERTNVFETLRCTLTTALARWSFSTGSCSKRRSCFWELEHVRCRASGAKKASAPT